MHHKAERLAPVKLDAVASPPSNIAVPLCQAGPCRLFTTHFECYASDPSVWENMGRDHPAMFSGTGLIGRDKAIEPPSPLLLWQAHRDPSKSGVRSTEYVDVELRSWPLLGCLWALWLWAL
ncbi:hypothetical protein CMQ_4799 [Grosmannia clavigera kw1407]|uniref:Uncharacterized protein n=1 Tax=Grosmannia clavigera (strain kw1407 / UAMH 11150) TaxID=655863 RepID=F0XV28_GROCL|nr:uncharacterized protein CMQ_4799 [Grosmannia clavigera kw1407]EFW98947.1 hypothetical protein CMQ_4799 [Grosmannia clavigera kw1407]